jgi:cephalosporin-C deacetylase
MIKQRTLTLLGTLVLWVAVAERPLAYALRVHTDRPDALYSCGETARFHITLSRGNAAVGLAKVYFQIDRDGLPPVQVGALMLTNGVGVLDGIMPEPGFLSCRVTYTNAQGENVKALAAAGFTPTKIIPSLPVPEDFDEFWGRQKALLRAVPMRPVLTSAPSPNGSLECFDVQINCHVGPPVSGYFARPRGAAPGSLPAILTVQGAGVRSSSLGDTVRNADSYGAMVMDINAHGLPNGMSPKFYQEVYEGPLRDYQLQGRENRQKAYFLGMFLRVVRTLDFLAKQPEWDGRNLIVMGGSQGGGQAIAAAGLDSRVTLICAGIPAICDHSGMVAGRAAGWPKLVPMVDGKPDPQVLQVARYFDGVNFATRARGEACFSVGFIDGVCPPSSVYAAFNAWPGKKRMISEPLMAHESTARIQRAFDEAVRASIARIQDPMCPER